jgi:hypothetical protein
VLSIEQLVRDYGDAYEEARICCSDCALFDFSFVHHVRVSGTDAARQIENFAVSNYLLRLFTIPINKSRGYPGSQMQGENYHSIKRSSLTVFPGPP